MFRSDEQQVVGFEITEIPRSYIDQSVRNEQAPTQSARVSNQQLGRFLSSTLYADVKLAFRIESDHGNCRYAYLFRDKDSRMFESIYRAHFQDFDITPFEQPPPDKIGGPVHVCILTGVPRTSMKALDAISNIISEFSGQALYQVYTIPAKPSRFKRYVSKHRIRTALEQSQKQQTDQGMLSQEVRTRIILGEKKKEKRGL